MALKITPIESLRKGTIKRLELLAEVEKAKADPASKPAFFPCVACGHSAPITEAIRRRANGTAMCKACAEKADALRKGTYRYGAHKPESYKRKKDKMAKKSYATGKLPKWMFS